MPAYESLNKQLFHGTGAMLGVGDVIEPRTHNYLYDARVAFATTNPDEATEYAYSGMLSNESLLGAVYEVEPVDPEEEPPVLRTFKPEYATSKKGFRIKGVHKWVTRGD